VKAAIVMQKTSLPYPKAITRLRKAHDSMREALGEDIEPRLRGMLQGAAEGRTQQRRQTVDTPTRKSRPASASADHRSLGEGG
jgi:hypothetical protein